MLWRMLKQTPTNGATQVVHAVEVSTKEPQGEQGSIGVMAEVVLNNMGFNYPLVVSKLLHSFYRAGWCPVNKV